MQKVKASVISRLNRVGLYFAVAQTRSRRWSVVSLRSMVIAILIQVEHYPQSQVASMLNLTQASISRAYNLHKNLIETDASYRDKFNRCLKSYVLISA